MFLNRRLLGKIYFLNRLFVRAIFSCIHFVCYYCPSNVANVLIYFSQVLMLPSYRTILVYTKYLIHYILQNEVYNYDK